MKITIVHVITSLRSGRAELTLKHLALAEIDARAARHVVVSLTNTGLHGNTLRKAGVELHCLELSNFLRLPRAFFRLVVLLRKIRPDVVMTWLYHADLLGTLAAIVSGVGARRVVWNLSCSNANSADTPRVSWTLALLTWLSPLPSAVVVRSRVGRRAHEALGFSPRRWFYLSKIVEKSTDQTGLDVYRQLWRFASGIEPSPPIAPGQWRRLLWARFPRLKIWSAHFRRFSLRKTTFVAVTGSCGKSTTTRLSAAILASDGPCYLRDGDTVFRGSVKTVLSAPAASKYCVQEASGFPPGDIAKHSKVLRPEVAIVTTIGGDHYKSFRSLEATAREKGQLVESLPRHGTAILNADDPHVQAMATRTRARVLTFGLSPNADIRATNVSSLWPDRLKLTVLCGRDSVPINTRLVGEHWTTSVLAAIACGIVCGIDLRTCAQAIEKFDAVFGRYSIHRKKSGGPVYVLDTQKAPFWTIQTGLTFLKGARAPRKTAVFGTISDMAGATSAKYRKVARESLEVADRVVFVGPNAHSVSKLFQQKDLRERLLIFQTSYQAAAFLDKERLPDELIYVKASIADHLERIMLTQLDKVVCWRERCQRQDACVGCRYYRKPHAPPLPI